MGKPLPMIEMIIALGVTVTGQKIPLDFVQAATENERAYEKRTYEKAKAGLNRLKPELKLLNESALASLQEALEETFTLHRLGLFTQLGISLKTTNCIESVMFLVGQHTDKVDCWKNSSQKHRWTTSALLQIESRLRRIKGIDICPR
jgi:putative transposase